MILCFQNTQSICYFQHHITFQSSVQTYRHSLPIRPLQTQLRKDVLNLIADLLQSILLRLGWIMLFFYVLAKIFRHYFYNITSISYYQYQFFIFSPTRIGDEQQKQYINLIKENVWEQKQDWTKLIDIYKLIIVNYNGYMLNSRKKLINAEQQNKENKIGRSSSSIDMLNYKINRSGIGLVEKDYNAADERIKILMNHKEELQKMRESQATKHKQEAASMLRRTITLQNTISQLEQTKIQNQEQIDYLKEKIKVSSQKFMSQIQRLKLQMRQLEKFNTNNDQTSLLEQSIKDLLQQNKKIKHQYMEQTFKSKKLTIQIVKLQDQIKQLQMQKTITEDIYDNNHKLELQNQLEGTRKLWNEDIKKFQLQIGTFQSFKQTMIIEHQHKIQKYQQQIAGLSQQIQLKQNKIMQLQRRFENINKKYQHNQLSKASITDSFQKSQKKMDQIVKSFNEQNQKKSKRIKQLEKQLSCLIQQRDKTQRTLQKLKYQQIQYKQRIEQLNQQINRQKQITVSLQQSILKWQKQCKKVTESRDQFQAELLKFKSQLTKTKQMQSQVQVYRKKHQNTVDSFSKQIKQSQNKLKSIIQQKQKQIENLYKQIQLQKANSQALKKQYQNIQKQLEQQKLKNQQTLEQLQQNREKYQKALRIQTAKNDELNQLVNRLKEKFELDQVSYKHQIQKDVSLLKQQIENYQIQLSKFKKQALNLKETINSKQRQFERKLRVAQDQKDYLQVEVKKWKQYRNQTNNQFQQLRKQNRKMKLGLQQKQQIISKLKMKIQSINELQLKCKQLQQEKINICQKNQTQISELKKKYDQKIDEISRQNHLLEEKIKAKIQAQLHSSHNEQLAKIRRKSEDNTFTINRYQQKVEDLTIVLQENQKNHKIQIQKLKKQIEKRQVELISNNLKYEQIKKKIQIYSEQMEDLEKKCRQKDYKIQELVNKLKRTSNTNLKYEYQLQQIQLSLKEIQKQKWMLQEKRKNIERQGSKLEAQKYELQNQLKAVHKKIKQCQSQLDEQLYINKKKSEQFFSIKENYQKLENQFKMYKQKNQTGVQRRKQVYNKLSLISTEYFQVLAKENQLQFLMVLYEKLKGYVQINEKLIQDRKSMKREIKNQGDELMRSINKNAQSDANLKQNYDNLYKKYLKYKDAYIHCKTKLQRHRLEVINDQRFTQEIISHCITLIPKLQ